MYLTFQEYTAMGGTLENAAFAALEKKAEYAVNSQASGRTGTRMARLEEIPAAVKDCIFELISFYGSAGDGEKQIASESQSQGGASESVSYVTKTDEEMQKKADGIIRDCLYGGGFGYLLYKGALV